MGDTGSLALGGGVAALALFSRTEVLLPIVDGLFVLPHTFEAKLGGLAPLLARVGFRFDGPWLSDAEYSHAAWGVFWLAWLWLLPNTQQLMRRFEPAYRCSNETMELAPAQMMFGRLAWRPSLAWASLTALIVPVAVLGLSRVSEFLYFQF